MISFTADTFARIGDGARRVEERAGSQEKQIADLLSTAQTDVDLARAALSRRAEMTQACVDRLATAVRTQLRRSEECVINARKLCAAARENRLAIHRLVTDLTSASDAETLAAQRGNRHGVLVVDDYEDTRDLVSLVLSSAGFVVRTASNGLEGIIAAYEMRPSVILMDVTMPVLDGLEATRLIKALDAIRDARVIAYTAASSLNEIIAKNLFAAVLQKPASPDAVIATVRQCANA
ncbi:MAG TPA: response regulator [Vicinamibacterales bacterium]|nr:response regulator [Vicinamibacterales bacterium]